MNQQYRVPTNPRYHDRIECPKCKAASWHKKEKNAVAIHKCNACGYNADKERA